MTLQRSEVVHVSILAPPDDVVSFLSDVNNWTAWAPWIRSVGRSSPRDWLLNTDVGAMKVRFVEANSLGVLDHNVTLASGITVFNSMRVLPNGAGSELVMVMFQRPDVSSEEFERDVGAVRADLARLKETADTLERDGSALGE